MSTIAKKKLIDLLQRAHAGELAAAYAYSGHAKSVASPQERAEILQIMNEELEHRSRLRQMLQGLGAAPVLFLERKMALIGRTISLLCRIGGWFIPMYGAGKLERGNLVEYEIAARLAFKAGEFHLVEELLAFGELEWQHEQYFRSKVQDHWMIKLFWIWPAPPPLIEIRNSYQRFLERNDMRELSTAVFSVNRLARYKNL